MICVWVRLALVALTLAAIGCATRPPQRTTQFEALPTPEVGAQDLEPAKPNSTTDLLRAADRAFREANAAQEKGDKEGALRHYTKMLELLIEADLDPVIFYNLRREFARILDSTSQQLNIFERRQSAQAGGPQVGLGVSGDLPIPFPLPEPILRQMEEIRQVYPHGFQSGLDRSFKYATYVRSELAKAGLPQDLFWLAIVESWYNPKAYSRAGAAGMWQFMRDTGRRYGLRIDNYVDERFDWEKSTHAAIAYLKDLHQMLGEWPLAISAYNMGEFGMARVVEAAGGETDIWKILESSASGRMQEETQKFYPKLCASIIVASSPERYGFTVNPQAPDEYVRVPVSGSYPLAALEKACELPEGTLKALNPELVRGVTPPTGEFAVATPVDANARLVAALESVPQQSPRSLLAFLTGERSGESSTGKDSAKTYTVKRGDTLSSIGAKFGVSADELKRVNNIHSSKQVLVGKRLTIPGKDETPAEEGSKAKGKTEIAKAEGDEKASASASSAPGSGSAKPAAERRTHRVKSGDTLLEIAKRYDVTPGDIENWNGISKGSKIRVNQKLYISPPEARSEVSKSGKQQTHVVKAGECPATIAAQYGVKLEDLLSWNKLSEKSTLQVDQKLTIFAPEPASASSSTPVQQAKADPPEKSAEPEADPPEKSSGKAAEKPKPTPKQGEGEKRTYQVAKGENPSTLAQKHGVRTLDVLRWNGWEPTTLLKVGQEYVVYTKSGENQEKQAPAKSAKDVKEETKQAAKTDKKNEETPKKEDPAKISKIAKEETKQPTKTEKKSEKGQKIIHTVTTGQNPTTIARRYGVSLSNLLTWNGWDKAHVLRVGDTVVVYTN